MFQTLTTAHRGLAAVGAKGKTMQTQRPRADNVVQFSKPRTEVTHTAIPSPLPPQEAIMAIESYWRGLCQDGQLPRRSDIDPRGIQGALEYTFVLERIAPGLARFRIAGQHLCDLMGMEVRGMPFSSLFGTQDRVEVGRRLEQMFSAPAIVEWPLQAAKQLFTAPVKARMLILPLRDEKGLTTRALGAMVSDKSAGRSPRRLNLCGTDDRYLALDVPKIHNAAPTKGFGQKRAFTDTRADFMPKQQKGPDAKRPALQLITNSFRD
jgi:hypothetical protein